jgi:hypothetical protein
LLNRCPAFENFPGRVVGVRENRLFLKELFLFEAAQRIAYHFTGVGISPALDLAPNEFGKVRVMDTFNCWGIAYIVSLEGLEFAVRFQQILERVRALGRKIEFPLLFSQSGFKESAVYRSLVNLLEVVMGITAQAG